MLKFWEMAYSFTLWYSNKAIALHDSIATILYEKETEKGTNATLYKKVEDKPSDAIGAMEADIIRMERKRIAGEK